MKRFVFLAVATLVGWGAVQPVLAVTFTSHGQVPLSEANHNVAFGVSKLPGGDQFVYASGETLYRAPVQFGLSLGDWDTLGSGLGFGDPVFLAVDPVDPTRAAWGDGGLFGASQPVRLVTDLEQAAASFGAPIVSPVNNFAAEWLTTDELLVAANDDSGSGGDTISIYRVFNDSGWQTQEIANFGAGFSGGITLADNGDLFIGVTDANTFAARTYTLSASEISDAIANASVVMVDGDNEADPHFLADLGANGDYAVAGGRLFVSGFQFDDQIASYRLSDGFTTMHTVTGVSASFVGIDLEADGDVLYAMRRREFFGSQSVVDLYSAVVPEPSAIALLLLVAAGVTTRRHA